MRIKRKGPYVLNDDVIAASAVYLGGRTYEVTAQEAAELTAAGYGAYITTL
jgi:hypothetical protein